jgi:hypothetical protein
MISAPILISVYGVWALLFSEPDERLLLTPIALSTAVVAAMLEHFWRRDRHLPIVDVGVLCALITLLYAAMPTIFYIKSGYAWSDLSEIRMVQMQPTPEDVADVLWYVAAYIAALCAAYGFLRGRGMPGPEVPLDVAPSDGWVLLGITLAAVACQVGVELFFDVDLNPSNATLQENYGIQQLPLFIAQIMHNILGIGRIAKLGLIAFAISRRSWLLAWVLAAWLVFEGYSTASTMGARTNFVILVLAVVLSIHRAMRPFGPVLSLSVGSALVAGLLLFGYVRDGGLGAGQVADVWSASNEFQVLLANGIHIVWAHDRGIIGDVPWAIKLSDLIMLIPQQLLPFQKLDPSDWYVEQIGATNQGVGLMFGVVAQAKLGYGVAEIVVRGVLLGSVMALIHRACVKHAASLAAFIVYLWLCTSIYYTYRATTFYIASWAVYRLIPFLLLFWFFKEMFGSGTAKPGLRAQAAEERS